MDVRVVLFPFSPLPARDTPYSFAEEERMMQMEEARPYPNFYMYFSVFRLPSSLFLSLLGIFYSVFARTVPTRHKSPTC